MQASPESEALSSSAAVNVISDWHRTAVLQQLCESPIHANEIVLLRRVLRRPDVRQRLTELISGPSSSSPESNRPSVDDSDDVSESSLDVEHIPTLSNAESIHEEALPQQQGASSPVDSDEYRPRAQALPPSQVDNPPSFPPRVGSGLNNSPRRGILSMESF